MSNGPVNARADSRRAAGHCEHEKPTISPGKESVAPNAACVMPGRLAGAIIAGLDERLRQIAFECLDSQSGEITRGRIAGLSAVRPRHLGPDRQRTPQLA